MLEGHLGVAGAALSSASLRARDVLDAHFRKHETEPQKVGHGGPQAWHPQRSQEVRQEDCQSSRPDSLGCRVKALSEKGRRKGKERKEKRVVPHGCNLSTWEPEAGRFQKFKISLGKKK